MADWGKRVLTAALAISGGVLSDWSLTKAMNEAVVSYARYAIRFNKTIGCDVLRPRGFYDYWKSKNLLEKESKDE